jgi:lipopolysaccharide export system permease protein
MYHVLAHRPGGQPIGMLGQGFVKLGSMVRKLLPRQEMRA